MGWVNPFFSYCYRCWKTDEYLWKFGLMIEGDKDRVAGVDGIRLTKTVEIKIAFLRWKIIVMFAAKNHRRK